jgi:4-hydroxythreonine-4-phosphate dehydrogenase
VTPPTLAITLGDVRGIGPEVAMKAIADPRLAGKARYRIVGPSGVTLPGGGAITPDDAVGEWVDGGAVRLALEGSVDGIVTAPLDKRALLAGGYDYPGHTEMLAELTGSRTAMMLAGPAGESDGRVLRVVLATTHIALRDVPGAVTLAALAEAAQITRDGLARWFGLSAPRLALCALNPHAGDGGRFGDEDERILRPAARAAGMAGPLPADTVFVRAMRGEFDAVIAPYHDVGMTAIKVASFGRGVNVTLGLPFPRTSPDHGTALDIAGQGIADASSMVAAIEVAVEMVERRRGA